MILLRKNTDGANYYLQQTICFLLQQQQLLNGTINVTWVRLEPKPTALGACTLPLCYRSLLRKLSVFGVFKDSDMILLRKSTDGANIYSQHTI